MAKYIWIRKRLDKRGEAMSTKYATDAYTSDDKLIQIDSQSVRMRRIRRKVDYGITKTQFHNILDKACHPIMKPESGQEQS